MKRKHGLSLFLASCIPGCGQMHQGYMKRGLSLLAAFCGVFFLAVFLEVGAMAVLMLPVWLYAFFDSYNLRAQTDEEAAANPDAYLFGLSELDAEKLDALLKKRHSLIGWGLVVLGIYLLWQRVADWLDDLFAYLFGYDWGFYYSFRYDIPRLAVTILIIALGVWFIRGPKKAKGEDIPAFTPPAAEPEAREPQTEAGGQGPQEEAPHGDE
nr:hypothetical protein [uncultured Dysosmobacter sp.]